MTRLRRGFRATVVVVSVLALGSLSAAPAVGAAQRQARVPSLTLGIGGDPLVAYGHSAARGRWIHRAVSEGASIARVNVVWREVAPHRPRNPANPKSRGYHWTTVDSAVRELHARGLNVMLMLYYAPRWAEGHKPPRAAKAGSWRPNAKAFAQFATAAARRYDGHYRDPLHHRHFLPRVRYWQAWNEPNLDQYLSPQRVKDGKVTVGPDIYRHLLNGFYGAVKRVRASNFVVSGGTTSFGNGSIKPLGRQATAPVTFYRDLFCLQGHSCAVHLDAIDHHPYNARGPSQHAAQADEVSVPDVYKLAGLLRTAVRRGHALPHRSKPIWVTELGWSSNPPSSRGVPMNVDARWYELAFYLLWKQGVRVIMPLLIGDPGLFPGRPAVLESGLFFHSGRPKPIAAAYKFPFVVQNLSPSTVRVWGRSPAAGRISVEVRRGLRWQVVRTLRVRRWQVFEASLPHRGNSIWRALVGSHVSLTWNQGASLRR